MKRFLLAIVLLCLAGFAQNAGAQQFYQEEFDGTVCAAGSGCDPSLVGWSVTNTGTNGANANRFFISCQENGNNAGQCGSGCGSDQSLHIGNVSTSLAAFIFCPTGDCGAAYDDSSPAEATDKRAESPVISCVGQSNITCTFVYMENGEGSNDDASFWYFNGATWAQLDPIAKSPLTCAPQGTWTNYSVTLPASANNNPNVRIGFRWVNNGNGNASDPSFAVDDIRLISNPTTPPLAAFTQSATNICAGDPVTFTDQSTGGPTSWSWSFPGGTPATSTAQNPVITYATPGTYSVTLTVTNGNGSNSTTSTNLITVTTCTSPPTAAFSASLTTICSGDAVNFTDLSTGSPTSWSWTFTGGTPATSTVQNPSVTYATPGTYTVTLTVTNANGSDTETITNMITVNNCSTPPTAAFSANTTAICIGQQVTFTDQSTGTPTGWSWSFPGGTPATSTLQNPVITYSTPGTYDVTLTVTNSGGSNSTTTTNLIVVSNCTVPVASFTPSATNLCAGACVTFNNTSTDATLYNWTFPGGTPSSSTLQNPGTICFNTPGSYQVVLTVSDGITSSSTTSTITVNPNPTVFANADTTIDIGNSAILTAVATGLGTYIWTPSTGLSSPGSATTTAAPLTTTTYTVTFTENGCSATDQVTVFVNVIEGIGVPNAFSPNNDGINDVLMVYGQGIQGVTFIVYNRYGQKMFETNDPNIGWDGKYDQKMVNTGVFVWYLEYSLVSGASGTLKGNVTLTR
ncbi:MAG TPA: PKD domain-containing protein [Flavobacteriales bacterium]|nr:hypothetical protein [Flavobacteriales bacterium]HRE76162.1 PKD domain-containing protein [Flavobacteriales bacterium]HRE96423.1 PKD domain-containing protein [Flavobacteriales bacterium]HRJ35249.1 PKD domain-containing protein [Flavobacteriales bacterium]HRJ39883.1 PKD domain-containing protein [Flavobacteriales bacterium]